MKWFALLLSTSCLVPLSLLVRSNWSAVNLRVQELERVAQSEGAARARALHALRAEIEEIEALIGEVPGDVLALRIQEAESRLSELNETITSHDDAIESLDAAQEEFGPAVLEARLQVLDETQRHRIEALEQLVEGAAHLAEASHARTSEADLELLWSELVGPVVQLAGDKSVGSGVLLESRRAGPDAWETHLLTAWHVVRDIQGDLSHQDMPVPVAIYRPDGSVHEETATLLAFQPEIDVALLRLDSEDPVRYGTRLAPPETVSSVRTFDPIVAVGCPLGNDPIPTRGEIATARHEVDGTTYWMINAPTYIGNSGGAIFDAESHELLGIFSKIYTHGSLRPTVVPHMGLVTPLDSVYEWLVEIGREDLIPGDPGGASQRLAGR